jgi:hypothetical protein
MPWKLSSKGNIKTDRGKGKMTLFGQINGAAEGESKGSCAEGKARVDTNWLIYRPGTGAVPNPLFIKNPTKLPFAGAPLLLFEKC